MEISTANTERRAKMSDVMLARNIIREIAGDAWNGKGDMIARVHRACVRAGMPITLRRVRSFWHREAASVSYSEMMDLAEVAAIEKARREQTKEARESHADFIRRASDLLDRLVTQDEEFHREHAEALRALALGTAHATVARDTGESYSDHIGDRKACGKDRAGGQR